MGPGMSVKLPYFRRRTAVSDYARQRVEKIDAQAQEELYQRFTDLDLSDEFKSDDRRIPLPSKEQLEEVLARMGKFRPEDELDCGACGYETCREHAIAIHKGLAESEMCLPYTIDRLKQSLQDLNVSNTELAKTQRALINAEKMASMGQLSAGIAHEINNPLGVILLYSQLLMDNLNEQSDDYEDLKMIVEQAERCKSIVAGLLNFARESKVNLRQTDICDLINRALKGIIKPAHIQFSIEHQLDNPLVEIDPDQMMQVLTNLIMNAIEAMPDGGKVDLKTRRNGREFTIIVQDNGPGIPHNIRHKIFEPLFTTKQIGKGTGLGLAVTYGIIKMHSGKIDVISNDDPANGPTGTQFILTLPISRQKNKN
jgi:signal transduction histidine kinase